MSDIFTEVDRDLRAQRAEELWRRYGGLVIAAAVAIVLGTAAYVGWKEWERRKSIAAGDAFQAAAIAAERGDPSAAAAAAQALAGGAPSGYALLSRLAEAGWLAEQGRIDDAIQRYEALANSLSGEREFRDLALISAAKLRLDRDPPATVLSVLEPLSAATAPYRFTARELRALAQLKAGDQAAARVSLQALADDLEAPSGVRARASELLQAIGG
ncbi:MAG: tetratricopeptide repeat protein [Alphaproteobacteria bacterium]|nr:tetratricopeptide repeat protein [Alphaproteobacteria bacterium]